MKKTLGWGYKFSSETFDRAAGYFLSAGGLHRTKEEALKEIKNAKLKKYIPKESRPRIFKVVIQIEE